MRHELYVPGRPKTKQRPRLGRGRKAFTPMATIEEEQRIAEAWDGPLFDGPVSVHVDYSPEGQLIVVESVDWNSPLTGDTDNYLKLTLDALQRERNDGSPTAFTNDRMVVDLWAQKHPRGTFQ